MRPLYVVTFLFIQTVLPTLAAGAIIFPKPDEPIIVHPDTSEPASGTSDPGEAPGSEGGGSTNPLGAPKTVPESESPVLEELGEHLKDIIDLISSLLDLAIPAATSTAASSSATSPLIITANPTITPAPTTIPSGASACLRAAHLYDSCASSLSPSFSAMPKSSQASCLCYNTQNNNNASTPTSSWLPYMGDCYSYVQTKTILQNQTKDILYAANMCSKAQDEALYSSTALPTPTSPPFSTGGADRLRVWSCNPLFVGIVGLGFGFHVV
ncbi:hypothetical protein MMC14_000618 [Varicellaria rhodocarpa]|nr:hypothetical protein [Varicellaria rhodocarpa]